MRIVLSLAVFAGVAAALPQQSPAQQQPQQQQKQQQPAQCTVDTLQGFTITSPVNLELVNNSQAILPDGAVFLDSSNTTMLLQAEPKMQGETETVGGIKFKNDTDVSAELPQNSAFAISWAQEQAPPPPAQPTPAQPTPAQPTPAQPTPAQPTPAQPTPAQLVQGMQAQQPQQEQAKTPQTQVQPTRVQMLDLEGIARNVTEVISLFGTAEALEDQAGEGGQSAVGAQQAPRQQPAQPGQQQTGQQPQPGQKAKPHLMPDNVGGVVAYIGPEIQPGTYSFLITTKVTKGAQPAGGQQQAVTSQQAGGQRQSVTCRILTHPIRVVHAIQPPAAKKG